MGEACNLLLGQICSKRFALRGSDSTVQDVLSGKHNVLGPLKRCRIGRLLWGA